MPIAGLTDGGGQLPVIGDLRKGAEHTEGTAPKDLTYFRFTSPYPELEQQFREAYGAEPTEVQIRLPYPSVDSCLEAWNEQYTAGSMVRRCNGNNCVWQRTQRGIEVGELPCQKHSATPCQCKPVGRLHTILPVLGMLGTVTVRTTSSNDIRTLYRILVGLADPRSGAGLDLRSLPFVLRRVPRDIPTPGQGGKPVRRTKYLLDLQVDPSAVQDVIRALGTARPLGALPVSHTAAALPAPAPGFLVDPETGELLEDEGAEPAGAVVEATYTGVPEGPPDQQPPVAAVREYPKEASLPIPQIAWEKLGRQPDPGVRTLGDAGLVELTAWAGATYKTKQGRDFAKAAATVLGFLQDA